MLKTKQIITLLIAFSLLLVPDSLWARGEVQPVKEPLANLFAESFYIPSEQKLDHEVTGIREFSIVKTPSRERNAEYSIVTDFGKGVIKTRYLSGLETVDDINKHIKENLKIADFEGVKMRRLFLPTADGEQVRIYWVGDKSFYTADEARAEIELSKTIVESQGGNFTEMVREAQNYVPIEEEVVIEIKSPAQYKKEEDLALKFFEQMRLGEKLWGPLHGDPQGEPIIWQSFGETSYRKTNLENKNFNSMVGYWSNRLVFKGIRFPLNTIDPYVENTTTIEAVGAEYKSRTDFFAGLEWRPFARNPWLFNYRPFGDIPILEWIRNYRFYIMYGDRKNIKGEITNAAAHELVWGVQIFYEWGVELPPLDRPDPETFWEHVEDIVWGEYFGNYRTEKTNFGSEDDFDAFIFNSSVIWGIKLPGIPLPKNPLNNELMLMPYLRFEHVNNSDFSFPYQNRYSVSAGVRWMPFRTWKWKENEWLSKTKLFLEWYAIGKTQHFKQDGEAPHAVRTDLRVGLNFSSRRF